LAWKQIPLFLIWPCAPWLKTQVAEAVAADGYGVFELPSGAGHDGMAMIDGRICTVCNTELTPQNASEVKRGMFVLCKSCGRIMYA